MEQLKFKKLDYTVKNEDGTEEVKKSEGKLPTRATANSAGLDLYATRLTQEIDNSGKLVLVYHTDIAVEIPEGYVGFICMKSSISKRVYTTDEPFAQLVIIPCSILEPTLVEELSETERGEKGFGEATTEQLNKGTKENK